MPEVNRDLEKARLGHVENFSNLDFIRNDAEDETLIENLAVQICFGFFYIIIFVIGISGNVLVCYVVIKNAQMRKSVTNLFIGNLAVSNAILCLLSVPFTPLYTFMEYWGFGKTSCHLLLYSMAVSVYVSSWTLTGIAVDRYLVIIYPFRQRMKISVCLTVIVGIWLVTLLMSFPYFWYMDYSQVEHVWVCEEDWPSDSFRQVFNILTTVLQFVVPFFIIAFCYVCVSRKLRERTRPGSRNVNDEERARKRTRKTIHMLISMVALFLVLWSPLYVANLFDDLYQVGNKWPAFNVVFLLMHCIAMTSSCCNPFLYAWHNENFREEFKLVLPCFSHGTTGHDVQKAPGSRKLCNGKETAQESLLQTPQMKQTNSKCEMISMEPTTNVSKEQDQMFQTADGRRRVD